MVPLVVRMTNNASYILLLLFWTSGAFGHDRENYLLALHKTGSVLTASVAQDVGKEKDSGFIFCKEKTGKADNCNLGQFSNFMVPQLARSPSRNGRSVVIVRDPAAQVSYIECKSMRCVIGNVVYYSAPPHPLSVSHFSSSSSFCKFPYCAATARSRLLRPSTEDQVVVATRGTYAVRLATEYKQRQKIYISTVFSKESMG
jgi:hypothetical protein